VCPRRLIGASGRPLNFNVRRSREMSTDLILRCEITCPECGSTSTEQMPTDACVFFYECQGCHRLLRPLHGDCCVFCSFGDVKCPPVQLEQGCCRGQGRGV
jgi:hypothetical protein